MYLALAITAVVGIAVGVVFGRLVTGEHTRRQSGPKVVDNRDVVADVGVRLLTFGSDDVSVVLREAVNHLEIGVVVSSSSGSVIFRNRSADAMAGTHVGILLDDHLSRILSAARSGERSSRVVEVHGPPKMWLALDAESMPNGAAVATIQDVSERMRTDAMRTDFVTNISHELKTPVGAIAVLAEALEGEDDPAVMNRLVDHIVVESHRAVRTIDDLLKLSQIESTRPGDEVVELAAVIQSAISRGRIADAGRRIDVMAIEPPARIRVRGDRRQLTSAIGNLVENAVKYSHDGGIVQVRSHVSDNAIEIMVADQGVGIPARDLDRIFERFYRVDKARSRETGGSGLGLAIVRHVATNHGGAVLVSSQEGEGSTFVFRLPAASLVPDGEPSPDVEYSADPTFETIRIDEVDRNVLNSELVTRDVPNRDESRSSARSQPDE
jgi:two-component system, OmpR family, sensor histidine kinase SenX3